MKMDEQKSSEQSIAERREFLKKAGKVAVAAPAAVLLLSAASKKVGAVQTVSGIGAGGGGED
jgi:formiminotetrahydrofolate cyclodeaminase